MSTTAREQDSATAHQHISTSAHRHIGTSIIGNRQSAIGNRQSGRESAIRQASLLVSGEPVVLGEGIGRSTMDTTGAAFYAASQAGVLACVGGRASDVHQMHWIDKGVMTPSTGRNWCARRGRKSRRSTVG